ncbi:MAG: acyl-CoA thioesterase [Flavobacteriales bacterium]|nr:acyl-CoA thioesterase [Flavobacteriales bacterium]
MKASNEGLPLSMDIAIAWGQQDLFGHLNNVVYFEHMEHVRMHLLQRIGVLQSHEEQGLGVILAATECRFHRPVTWPSTLTIHTGVDRIGNTSFHMTYRTVDAAGALVAEGTSVQVMYDYERASKVRIPDSVRQRIGSLAPLHIPCA